MSVGGPWLKLMAAGAVAGTALAVVSGAAGWGTAHRLLAALALPWIVGLVVVAWISARRLLPAALTAFVKGFKKKWTARTDCRTGYVVMDCKQYKAPKTTATPTPVVPSTPTTKK